MESEIALASDRSAPASSDQEEATETSQGRYGEGNGVGSLGGIGRRLLVGHTACWCCLASLHLGRREVTACNGRLLVGGKCDRTGNVPLCGVDSVLFQGLS